MVKELDRSECCLHNYDKPLCTPGELAKRRHVHVEQKEPENWSLCNSIWHDGFLWFLTANSCLLSTSWSIHRATILDSTTQFSNLSRYGFQHQIEENMHLILKKKNVLSCLSGLCLANTQNTYLDNGMRTLMEF